MLRVTREEDVCEKCCLPETMSVESVVSKMLEWLLADEDTFEDVFEWDMLKRVGESAQVESMLLS